MPPKKKKSIVNPIVVGTVSTRSTRRQSIVNIDIPKSKSSQKSTAKNPINESGMKDNELRAAENLSEKIKRTYNKMFSKILEAPKIQLPSTKSAESPPKTTSKDKSNDALLQILEDWSDEDSHDDKKERSESDECGNIQETTETDENKGIASYWDSMIRHRDENKETVPRNEEKSSPSDCKAPIEAQERLERDHDIKMETDDENIAQKTENIPLNEIEVQETYIVEEIEPVVIEEHIEEIVAFEEEHIVECVTEEVITDVNDHYVLMDTTEDNSTSVIEVRNQEISSENEIINNTSQNIDNLMVETFENKEQVAKSVIVDETSQSLSTTDSNDAEVRSFFTKEIEDHKTVKEEDIPGLQSDTGDTSSDSGNVESANSKMEKHMDDKSDKNRIEELRREENIEIVNIVANNPVVEEMDTIEDVIEETIESRVAQMHLADETVKEEDTSDELSEMYKSNSVIDLNYPLKEDIEEVIGVKTSRYFAKEETKMEEVEKTHKSEPLEDVKIPTERPKTRRSKSVEAKTTEKEVQDEVETKSTRSKEKKPAKTKETKPKPTKELRSKKKPVAPPPSKKTRDKVEKKESGKTDKKDNGKKTSEQSKKSKNESSDFEDVEVRRSVRIKSISVLKKKTTGHGLVRSKSEPILNESDVSDSNSTFTESEKSTPSASPKIVLKERKTRWTRSSENLSSDSQSTTDSVHKNDSQLSVVVPMEVDEKPKLRVKDPVVTARLKQFVHLKENLYKTDRMTCKEAKKMTCDCFLTTEEREANEYGCGEDCLNRLLLIECGNLCQVGDRCTNKRFQKGQFAPVEVFNTEKKGLGLRAAANIPYGEFILEYVGEVLNSEEFDKRAEVYSQDKNIHYYFMALRADAIIDATMKGNISRFINHSCDPNAETQKWTVNGELRIGFFSTRTILAGEEITFDYQFQRYGKEAQKCYCEASICRGWLGEEPDEDSEDEEEEEEEEEQAEAQESEAKVQVPTPEVETKKEDVEAKVAELLEEGVTPEVKVESAVKSETEAPAVTVTPKRKSPRKKPRKDLFEELDPLDEEIDVLVATGLKNQAHTLKLSRLMVRAKEPPQRTKLLRVLRRGELPCRRLFLDYHGLRLMHGYMIDAQHLVRADKKYESLRLEMLQTLAVLPIPNKTMLQDSKVLPTVEKWSTDKDLGSPQDSDSNSPKNEQEPPKEAIKKEVKESPKKGLDVKKEDEKPERSIEDQEEEIRFLASKLLEGWTNLKEVFRIPKKERIEQMKEHEREANKKFMQGGYTNDPDSSRKSDRYRHLSRYKLERDSSRKGSKSEERPSAEFIRLSKIERRKLFALQHELKEEERRLKQREMWRQHEVNCMLIGTDPRFTAPFDPSRGYQYIWNPQIGQWQNYPLPPQNQIIFPAQAPAPSVAPIPNLSMPPPQIQVPKSVPAYPYPSLNGGVAPIATSMAIASSIQPPIQVPSMQIGINSMQGIPGALPQTIATHAQIPATIAAQPPLPQYPEPPKKEEDPSQVKFMGPIPPPAKLPPKWKCAKDKYGRPYYYHIKIRKSQWEPPPIPEPVEEPEESSETESSSDTSTLSSESSSENSDSEDDIDDTRLLMEVRKQMEKSAKMTIKSVIPDHVKIEDTPTPSPDEKNSEDEGDTEDIPSSFLEEDGERPSIDIRLKEQFNLLKDDNPPKKKRRVGLCEEIMISPRSEEDRLQFKEDLKRYKANKEKLKKQKELILQQTRKQLRESDSKKIRDRRARAMLKTRIKEMPDFNSEQAKKIKEVFRSNMASTVVASLNAYRKPDCKEGRITNTDDFKHLARKLTHFVMLKEMKHIEKIEDLTCTDNVKSKAREYIRKYMSKFGEVYIKRNDSPDFKD